MDPVHLLIVAKQPLPGRAKTRLIPAFGPEGAAELAMAALLDTFDAVRASRIADRVVVSFDGDPAGVVPAAFEVVPQRRGDFATRLQGAWDDAAGPGLQIGMDTPQLTGADLDAALGRLLEPGTDAVLGPAVDGGWWGIGLRSTRPDLFADVPMSAADTGIHQLDRLATLGLRTAVLAEHRDVDHPEDVGLVAGLAPHTRFAEVARRLLADSSEAGIAAGAR